MPDITLEPFQIRATHWLLNRPRGILVSPAGSGKTIMAAAAISMKILNEVLDNTPRQGPLKVGWMSHTIEQKQQAAAALEKFPHALSAIDLRLECAASECDWADRELLIVDEVHWAGCDQWGKQVLSCPHWRWGFTATPFTDDPERNERLLAMFDRETLTIDRIDVAQRLAPARVIMLDATDAGLQATMDAEIEHTFSWRKHYWKGDPFELKAIITWQVCIKRGIVGNKARNLAVVNLARQHAQDSVLILVNEIDHGKMLADSIPGARLCYSRMGKKSRRETLESFKEGRIRCIIATSLADEGLDLPIANILILVSGGRSSAKTEQRTGRVLRAFSGKKHGVIYDFSDRQHSTMERHAQRRISVYRKLGYQVQFPWINL